MSRRNEITLEFEDGSQEVVRLKVRYLIEAEDKYGKGTGGFPPLKGTVYAAWLSLGKPGNSFQSFVRTIDFVDFPDGDEVNEDEDEDEETPTQAAGSDES
ncbi:MAG: hypothetical protein LC798_03090 [Chloroflexi bacterium]|nr:hypothetical protein [Chloroflexota bacterium]